MTATEKGAAEADELLGRLIVHAGKNKGRSTRAIKDSICNIMLSKFSSRFLLNQEIFTFSDKELGQVTLAITIKFASLIYMYAFQEK